MTKKIIRTLIAIMLVSAFIISSIPTVFAEGANYTPDYNVAETAVISPEKSAEPPHSIAEPTTE